MEGVFKIIDIFEILNRIFLGLLEEFGIDQIKNDFSKVTGFSDPPILQNRPGHRTKLLEGIILQPAAEFFSCDVAGLGEAGNREVKPGHGETVSFEFIMRISGNNLFDLLKHPLDFFHTIRSKAGDWGRFNLCSLSLTSCHFSPGDFARKDAFN